MKYILTFFDRKKFVFNFSFKGLILSDDRDNEDQIIKKCLEEYEIDMIEN